MAYICVFSYYLSWHDVNSSIFLIHPEKDKGRLLALYWLEVILKQAGSCKSC